MSDKSGQADQTFTDILKGMQHAVNTAQQTLQEHQFMIMQQYFDTVTGAPHMMFIVLPDGRKVEFPQISLIPQSLLGIEELEMSFSVAVARSEVKTFINKSEDSLPPETSRSSFLVTFARRRAVPADGGAKVNKDKEDNISNSDTIDVKIKFKSIPLPEGAARIQDMLNLGIGG